MLYKNVILIEHVKLLELKIPRSILPSTSTLKFGPCHNIMISFRYFGSIPPVFLDVKKTEKSWNDIKIPTFFSHKKLYFY